MAGEGAAVPLALGDPRLDELLDPAQLGEPECGLQVRHPVVEADLAVGFDDDRRRQVPLVVRHRDAVVPERAETSGQVAIPRDDHPALAGGDQFPGMKAEDRDVAVAPGPTPGAWSPR